MIQQFLIALHDRLLFLPDWLVLVSAIAGVLCALWLYRTRRLNVSVTRRCLAHSLLVLGCLLIVADVYFLTRLPLDGIPVEIMFRMMFRPVLETVAMTSGAVAAILAWTVL